MASPETIEEWKEAKPFIRSLAAFVLVTRFGVQTLRRDEQIQDAYRIADIFVEQLEKDLQA